MKRKKYLLVVRVEEIEKDPETGRIRVQQVGWLKSGQLWVHPSHLVDVERLDYGRPEKGDRYLSPSDHKFIEAINKFRPGSIYLVERKEGSWEEWSAKTPFKGSHTGPKITDWIKEGIEIGIAEAKKGD